MHKNRYVPILIIVLIIVCTRVSGADSIYVKQFDENRYFNTDSIFTGYAEEGFLSVIDDLYDYYEDIVPYLDEKSANEEINKIQSIVNTSHSKELVLEFSYFKAVILPESTDSQFQIKINDMNKVVEVASKYKNPFVKIRAMEYIFDMYWRTAMYAKAFHQILLIEQELKDIQDNQYPARRNSYFKIGEAHYYFKDYEKAIPYLLEAIHPAKYYFDRSNLKARNILGSYYNNKGKIDSAEYYFRSAYFSSDKVKSRSKFDAIALSNIGQSLLRKNEYDSAISYFKTGLSKMLTDYDYKIASEITVGLGYCYLAKRDLKKTKQMIDSSQLFLNKSNNIDLLKSLYELRCKYYARNGSADELELYLDSTVVANEMYAKKYSVVNILRAEQKLFEAQNRAKDEELLLKEENYKNKLFYGIILIIIVFIGLLVFAYLYRKKRKAYQALVLKNQDWAKDTMPYDDYTSATDEQRVADEDSVKSDSNEPTEDDFQMMKQVHSLVVKEKKFKDLDLTLDSLAKTMDVNRNYLSKAINKTSGKNFNTYINEYRVKEAIKIMSDEKSDLISIDAIALEVGFNNRTSFYQAFKKITGLSPSDFRNNKVKTNTI